MPETQANGHPEIESRLHGPLGSKFSRPRLYYLFVSHGASPEQQ